MYLSFSPLRIAVALLKRSKLTFYLNCLIYAVGIFSIVLTWQFNQQIEERLRSESKRIDLVVGAKGSPLQLILSSIYHLDSPTGNIPLTSVEALRSEALIKNIVPISIGDSVNGFRIVGTTNEFFDLYSATLASGQYFKQPMEAVLGAKVADTGHYKIGDTFVSSHGLSGSSELHQQQLFKVVGILNPSAGVLDRLCITNLESIWQLHQHPINTTSTTHSPINSQQVTAALIQYRSAIAAASLPRKINSETAMQAASPAFEITRMMHFLGLGTRALHLLSMIIVFTAAMSALIALTNMLDQNQLDFATMRTLGATPSWVFCTVITLGILIAFSGSVVGLIAAHACLFMFQSNLNQILGFAPNPADIQAFEFFVVGLGVIVGALSALLPAWRIYNQEVAKTLATAR